MVYFYPFQQCKPSLQAIRSVCIMLAIVWAGNLAAQAVAPAGGGAWNAGLSAEQAICVTPEQQAALVPTLRAKANAFLAANPDAFADASARLRSGIDHAYFSFPIRAKNEFADPGYFALTNYVDHNLAAGSLSDYNCGDRSYDWATGNHQGTDYILWPYPWQRMDDDVMEVVAGAPGVIIEKIDGNYDRSCEINGSTLWNAIHILHADGSIAWYLHFKTGSLTTKGIGEAVAEGEFLGTAGSSGSSDIPHLHFQVFDAADDVVDPYFGTCNSINPDTWWSDQTPYWEPQINRISTHDAIPEESCPNPESDHESQVFDPGDTVFFVLWYKDLLNGALTSMEVIDPAGAVYNAWDFTSPWADFSAGWAYWFLETMPTDALGEYTFRAVFEGETYERIFYLGAPPTGLADPTLDAAWNLFPNPSSGSATLQWTPLAREQATVSVWDAHGRLLWQQNLAAGMAHAKHPLPQLESGMYTVRMQQGIAVATKRWTVLR